MLLKLQGYQFGKVVRNWTPAQRREFVEWAMEQVDANIPKKTFSAMSLTFILLMASIIVKIVIYGVQKIHKWLLRQMHPQCVTVWCGFWVEDIIGLFYNS